MSRAQIPAKASRSLKAIVAWSAFWAGFGVVDALVPVPFSRVVRGIFHTDTPEGKLAFFVTLGLASGLFAAHIVK